MNAHVVVVLVIAVCGLGIAVWTLAKLGHLLAKIAEAVAAAAVLFAVLWLVIKAVVWAVREAVTHWRTSLAVLAVLAVTAWWHWLGWVSLVVLIGTVAVSLASWRLADLMSFDRWAGRWLRAWWLRWTPLHPETPGLAARLRTVRARRRDPGRRDREPDRQEGPPGHTRYGGPPTGCARRDLRAVLGRGPGPARAGQKPEDYDEAARALASARQVARCQVREVKPHVVSIDFQRRNLLADAVACRPVAESAVDVRRVWSGRTEYGQDWHVSLAGSHTLVAGSTGAGKNSVMWCPLVSIAPAIRDGLVRVSGIDPKGMELAYGRRIFHRYAATGSDALAVLDDLVGAMDTRKTMFAGRVRSVPISAENPLEVLEFDEIGALTKYTDRKTREAITERVALLTTQGRALGFTVRGYVQEPTKDTVPVRDLFPRRICLRVAAKSHVAMVLGDGAYERGAWANRIGESEAGVGYVFGEGVREPLRIRAGWVPDETIKELEEFVAPSVVRGSAVRSLPALSQDIRRGDAA
jgi:S-DNA-T family DNA segregation ATPase FtsK/SpoIIIE